METRPRDLHFNDDSNSLLGNELFQGSSNQSPAPRPFDQNKNEQYEIHRKYYDEYKKIYFTSFKLSSEIKKQIYLKESLIAKITQIQNQITALHKVRKPSEIEEEVDEGEGSSKRRNNKRTRRTAQEIQRKFYCQADYCDRCYGSEGSLQQHIKLKHPQIYKKEYQDLDE